MPGDAAGAAAWLAKFAAESSAVRHTSATAELESLLRERPSFEELLCAALCALRGMRDGELRAVCRAVVQHAGSAAPPPPLLSPRAASYLLPPEPRTHESRTRESRTRESGPESEFDHPELVTLSDLPPPAWRPAPPPPAPPSPPRPFRSLGGSRLPRPRTPSEASREDSAISASDAAWAEAAAPGDMPDSGVPDSGVPDSGVTDSGITDSGIADSGITDSCHGRGHGQGHGPHHGLDHGLGSLSAASDAAATAGRSPPRSRLDHGLDHGVDHTLSHGLSHGLSLSPPLLHAAADADGGDSAEAAYPQSHALSYAENGARVTRDGFVPPHAEGDSETAGMRATVASAHRPPAPFFGDHGGGGGGGGGGGDSESAWESLFLSPDLERGGTDLPAAFAAVPPWGDDASPADFAASAALLPFSAAVNAELARAAAAVARPSPQALP